jgi:hypothetical protein
LPFGISLVITPEQPLLQESTGLETKPHVKQPSAAWGIRNACNEIRRLHHRLPNGTSKL